MDPIGPAAANLPLDPLDPGVAEQAAILLEATYVHLAERRAQGEDPVTRLRELAATPPATRDAFRRELLAVFARLGDQHTQCYLPPPEGDLVAFLPFVVQDFHEAGKRHLMVVASALDDPAPGDLLLSWDGLPAAEAVADHMRHQLAAHPGARWDKALQTLTFRPLAWLPAPAPDVALELASGSCPGRRREVRLAWQVAPGAGVKERYLPALGGPLAAASAEGLVAAAVTTSSGTFGHLRVTSFAAHPKPFLAAFLDALGRLPPDGLILDLRGCEKGLVATGEQLLQLFTSAKIEPLAFQFRITKTIEHMVQSCPALTDWRGALARAARQGEEYSRGRPLTSPEEANQVGRRYGGPVVLLVDGLTYSTAEMVAAGFQDHAIGPVLGGAARTGGGGGSPWSQQTLFELSRDERLRPLPGEPAFRVAVRRCRRVGTRAGRAGWPLEGVGVEPDRRYRPTRADRLHGDRDLLERAGRWLAALGSQNRGARSSGSRSIQT